MPLHFHCSPGHSHRTRAPCKDLITLKGSPPPLISLGNLARYWNYQVCSNNLPASESRWTTVCGMFHWETLRDKKSVQCKWAKVLSCSDRCAVVSSLVDMGANRLNIYNSSTESQSALMYLWEMYHFSTLNNKYSSRLRIGGAESAAMHFDVCVVYAAYGPHSTAFCAAERLSSYFTLVAVIVVLNCNLSAALGRTPLKFGVTYCVYFNCRCSCSRFTELKIVQLKKWSAIFLLLVHWIS